LHLWLEQKEGPSEGRSEPIFRLPQIHCSMDQREQLEDMAHSRTIGIWRMKRAKIVIGALDGIPLEKLVLDIRVPPESVFNCVRAFSRQGLAFFEKPTRKPTLREARVEKMLDLLETPSKQKGSVWRSFAVRYIGIDFTGSMIRKLRAIIRDYPEATRGALAKIICREFGFYSAAGKDKPSTVADILKRMDMDNLIRLPQATQAKPYRQIRKSLHPLLQPQKMCNLDHRDLEPLTFVPVKKPNHQQLWNDMMSRYHYLKRPRLFGAQIRYIIRGNHSSTVSEEIERDDGILLGAIGFSHAAWHLADRDAFIGWNDEQRQRHLKRIIGNSRFLILPWIRCPNLASMILGRVAKRVAADWKAAYGIQPVLMETFVQQKRFPGTSYRAANWIEVGSTDGYSYFRCQKKRRSTKTIFLFPLCRNFRKELCGSS
jgi:hypothetical protein